MQWNIVPEYISLVFLSILLVYSWDANLLPTMKNRLFHFCLRFVLLEIVLSIVSIYAIEQYARLPILLNQLIQMAFFLAMPVMALLFLFYVIALSKENDSILSRRFQVAAIPYGMYAVLVMTNPLTGFLFHIDAKVGFYNGKGFWVVYAVPILYLIVMYRVILRSRERIEKNQRLILMTFPSVTLAVIVIQLFLHDVVLSGTAATASLLILYLFLQNRKIMQDDLTGFQNRKALLNVLDFQSKRNTRMSFLFVSLDDFKVVNDRYGQMNGDAILQAVSRFLAGIVPTRAIYRYSGDEFIIIFDKDIRMKVADVLEIVKRRFNEPWPFFEASCKLSASLATADFPDHAETVEDIITLLEYCIFTSKGTGKGKVIQADADMVGRFRRRGRIVESMRQGLQGNGFEVHYQPIFSVREDCYTTAEALLRLHDSELGNIPPSEFIPLAEETGLIVEIGSYVIHEVGRFLHELDLLDIEIEGISINLSALQLTEGDLAEVLTSAVRLHKIHPRQLGLEITESVFLDNPKRVAGLMQLLCSRGFFFYLDDFGTGYSNISNVVSLPFSYVKIDKSILYQAVSSMKGFHVLEGLTRMFSDSGMKLVLEGVETEEQKALSKAVSVDHLQGYLFSRPLPAPEVIALFHGRRHKPQGLGRK